MGMSKEEYFRITGKVLPNVRTPEEKISKHRNIKTNGYDSKLEYSRAQQLKLEEKLGVIKDLEEQKVFILLEGFKIESDRTKTGFEKIQPITYRADFVYHRIGQKLPTVEDSKGHRTEVYKMKRKMFLNRYGNQYNFLESIDKDGNTK